MATKRPLELEEAASPTTATLAAPSTASPPREPTAVATIPSPAADDGGDDELEATKRECTDVLAKLLQLTQRERIEQHANREAVRQERERNAQRKFAKPAVEVAPDLKYAAATTAERLAQQQHTQQQLLQQQLQQQYQAGSSQSQQPTCAWSSSTPYMPGHMRHMFGAGAVPMAMLPGQQHEGGPSSPAGRWQMTATIPVGHSSLAQPVFMPPPSAPFRTTSFNGVRVKTAHRHIAVAYHIVTQQRRARAAIPTTVAE